MDYVSVYVTTKDKAEAVRIGRALVEQRLAACANVVDGLTSLYWWEGAVHEDHEAAFFAKTRAGLVDELIRQVRALHSYSCPCIVCWPIQSGNPDYLQWIDENTRAASPPSRTAQG